MIFVSLQNFSKGDTNSKVVDSNGPHSENIAFPSTIIQSKSKPKMCFRNACFHSSSHLNHYLLKKITFSKFSHYNSSGKTAITKNQFSAPLIMFFLFLSPLASAVGNTANSTPSVASSTTSSSAVTTVSASGNTAVNSSSANTLMSKALSGFGAAKTKTNNLSSAIIAAAQNQNQQDSAKTEQHLNNNNSAQQQSRATITTSSAVATGTGAQKLTSIIILSFLMIMIQGLVC